MPAFDGHIDQAAVQRDTYEGEQEGWREDEDERWGEAGPMVAFVDLSMGYRSTHIKVISSKRIKSVNSSKKFSRKGISPKNLFLNQYEEILGNITFIRFTKTVACPWSGVPAPLTCAAYVLAFSVS
jgi:hypothetical protein